jgi:NAD(P)-dependent dehydrogenase (short-subunit alcohol dehydrogenase family)
VAGDISTRSTADALMAVAEDRGGLDIVVNNAGITRDRMLFNVGDKEWDNVIAVCLRGHFLLTRNAAAYWRSRAKESGGQLCGDRRGCGADRQRDSRGGCRRAWPSHRTRPPADHSKGEIPPVVLQCLMMSVNLIGGRNQ